MPRFVLASSVLAFAALAACGGGGGGDDDEEPPTGGPTAPGVASAAGLWTGTSTLVGPTPRVLVRGNGEMWNIYGGGNSIRGAHQGTVSWNGTQLTGEVTDFAVRAGNVTEVDFSGPYSAGATMTISTAVNGASTTYSLSYVGSHDTAAEVASIQGSWQLTTWSAAGPSSATATISSAGILTVSSIFCSGTGSVAPADDGKNYFTVTVAFSGSDCEFRGRTLRGVAYLDPYPSLEPRLIVAGLQSNRENGFVGYGDR